MNLLKYFLYLSIGSPANEVKNMVKKESSSKWKDYGKNLSKPVLGIVKLPRSDFRSMNGRQFLVTVFSSYLREDKRDLLYSGGISASQAISPAKLLNPFKLVLTLSRFFQVSILVGIDKWAASKLPFPLGFSAKQRPGFASHPVAQVAKGVLALPFSVINFVITPFATLEYLPIFSSKDRKKSVPDQAAVPNKENFDVAPVDKYGSSQRLILNTLEENAVTQQEEFNKKHENVNLEEPINENALQSKNSNTTTMRLIGKCMERRIKYEEAKRLNNKGDISHHHRRNK